MRADGARPGLLLALALALAACSGAPRGDCRPDPPPGEMGSLCGFRNPEDVEAVPSAGLLLVSQMHHGGAGGGSLAALSLEESGPPRRLWPAEPSSAPRPTLRAPLGDPTCQVPPPAAGFWPHGLAASAPRADGAVPVGVVVHGAREAIELFDLVGAGAAARLLWRGCLPLPEGVAGNDLVFAPEGGVVASNYQPTLEGLRGAFHMVRGGLGLATGDVLRWRPGSGWEHLAGTAGPNPNGVLLSPDGGTVYFAQTGAGTVGVVELASGRRREVAIGGHPDNLAWSPSGRVLAVTHSSGAAFLRCAVLRGPCRSAWSLFEIDPESLAARELLHSDGQEVGGVASVAEARGRTYFGAVFGDRIGVWRRAREGAAANSSTGTGARSSPEAP